MLFIHLDLVTLLCVGIQYTGGTLNLQIVKLWIGMKRKTIKQLIKFPAIMFEMNRFAWEVVNGYVLIAINNIPNAYL